MVFVAAVKMQFLLLLLLFCEFGNFELNEKRDKKWSRRGGVSMKKIES